MHEYDFNTYSVRKKNSKKKYVFWGIVLISIFFLFTIFTHKEPEKSTLGKSAVSEITHIAEKVVRPQNPLETVVTESLVGSQGKYSVVIVNKKKNLFFSVHEHDVYDAGSFYKLWIMAVVVEQLQSGQLKEDEVLHGDIAALNKKFHIATDTAELKEGEVNFTIKSALRQMITISHNYAALLLTEKVRLSTIKKFLTDHGLHESVVGINDKPPTTTASDIALFYDKLGKGEFADAIYTQQMFDLLKDQTLNNKLPLYLPENVIMAHKTAELGPYSHDGGIVYLPDGEYIIVVMSQSTYPPAAEEKIAQVSQAVYDYFTSH